MSTTATSIKKRAVQTHLLPKEYQALKRLAQQEHRAVSVMIAKIVCDHMRSLDLDIDENF